MKKLLGFFLAVVILVSPVLAASGSTVVYITRTGECYHTGSCRFLQKSRIETTLADAVARGYRACKVCRPPELGDGLSAAVPDAFGASTASPPAGTPTPSPTAPPSPSPTATPAPSSNDLSNTAAASAAGSEKDGASGLGVAAILTAGAFVLTRRRAKKK